VKLRAWRRCSDWSDRAARLKQWTGQSAGLFSLHKAAPVRVFVQQEAITGCHCGGMFGLRTCSTVLGLAILWLSSLREIGRGLHCLVGLLI
jgi:hypothetical protein